MTINADFEALSLSNGSSTNSITTQQQQGLLPSKPLTFFLNDKLVTLNSPDPDETLISYLRRIGLTGTKLGCGEGGCGSCTVVVSSFDYGTKTIAHNSVNACLAPLCSVDGKHVITIEGIGNTSLPHPVQERIANSHGSQCGFCSIGIAMSLYSLLKNNPSPTEEEIEDAFDGNLCRCTGYRPILDGAKTFAVDKEDGCSGECKSDPSKTCSKAGTKVCDKTGLVDLEDLAKPTSPLQLPAFPKELTLWYKNNPKPKSYMFGSGKHQWYHPSTLDEVLKIVDVYPASKIVQGNTEIGIETRFKGLHYPVYIYASDVPELKSVQEKEDGFTIGSMLTLTRFVELLKEWLDRFDKNKTRGFQALLDNLKWFAGHQIRNVAAIAGNICTASPISDLNPVLMAMGATCTVSSLKGGVRHVPIKDFFVGYRKTALAPGEVLVSIHIPFTKPTEYICAYKQARRRDDDIAIVNAGIRVVFSDAAPLTVVDATLSYGGMASTTIRALKTEKALIGRQWHDASLLDDIAHSISQELYLKPDVPGGQAAYRLSLAISFFQKFYVTVSHLLDEQAQKTLAPNPVDLIHRPLSSGKQEWRVFPDGEIGNDRPHLSALKQVTGEALYVDDIPKFSGELYAAIVGSKVAHGIIKKVDTSKALQMEGVRAWISADDIPGFDRNKEYDPHHNPNVIGPIFKDEELFATKEVVHVGQIIGLILADTEMNARNAARHVHVEYESLPCIVSIEDAIAANSFFPPVRSITTGEFAPQDGSQPPQPPMPLSAATHFVEGKVRMAGQEHFYLETNASLVVPKKEDNEMEIFASTQHPSETQHIVGHVLSIPSNRIVCRVKRLGGGFGGKETRSVFLSAAIAVAAKKLGVPVRCVLSREEDMAISGQRHPFRGDYKVGFTSEGKLVSLELNLYSNAGFSLDLSTGVMERALTHSDNCYYIPNVKVVGKLCKTNTPTNTAFRGFGGPQGMLVAETWIQHVAEYLGKPGEQIREMNLYVPNQMTHFRQPLENVFIDRVWYETLSTSEFLKRKAEVVKFNQENKYKKRGIVCIPTKFGIAFTARFLNQAGALVHIYTDGSVLLTHGGTEMGQGLHTKMVQVCAHTLDIPLEKVHLSETSTATVPNTSPTAASASSDLNGMAVLNACETLKKRLEPYRTKMKGSSWEEIIRAAYMDRVNLSANGFYQTPDLSYDWGTNSGRLFNYWTYGAACTEVEIDVLTGDHVVLRSDIVMDIGKSLNPSIDMGQIEGAFVQGLGWCTIEQPLTSPTTGMMLTRGPGAYKIPGFRDIPVDFRVRFVKGAENPRAIHSSKAVGEPPLFLGASAFFAIREAIQAARAEHGLQGYFPLDSPATSERIRLACVDKYSKLVQPRAEDVAAGKKPWAVEA